MVLSQTAEYALRAMAWLATSPEGVPVRGKDLSVATGIPTHYLSKVMRRMVVADLLVSQKGQGGGFLLSRPPGEIAFVDILIAVDAFPDEGRCAFGWGECDESRPCPLHNSWTQMNERIRSWATDSTLADIVRGEAMTSRSSPRSSSGGRFRKALVHD